MKKILPIGTSDYKKLIDNNGYYVDKTLLIKEIWESGEILLISRPRRFGKTLNVSMLQYFFEIAPISNEYLFNTKSIWNYPNYRQLHGQFPVISLTFKNIEYATFKDTYESFTKTIAAEFSRHDYLLSSGTLKPFEEELFIRIRDAKASFVEVCTSLEYLTHFLNRHFGKKAIVLIDEYDVPVQSAYLNDFYKEIIEFLKPLLTGAFKDNKVLEKGIITGILTLAKAGIFTGLNNLEVLNLTREPVADKFGFTHDEVVELLAYYKIESAQQAITSWYNGYTFGETEGIYNPWSVLNCVRYAGALDKYWAHTSNNLLVKRLIGRASASIKSNLELLLTDVPVEEKIEESIIFPDLDGRPELLWTLLLFTGYLTYRNCALKEGAKLCTLIIPNQEIKHLYRELLINIFNESVIGGQAENLLKALLQGDTDMFAKLLQSFVLRSMSAYDLDSSEPEKSYHLFVLGLLVMLSDTYEIKSNRESGLGRYDIMLIPKKEHQAGVVIEFKVARSGESLENAAQKALDQIIEKKYVQELQNRFAVSSIFLYGIAFEGKNVLIKSHVENFP